MVVLHSVQGAAEVTTRITTLLGQLCQPTQLENESVMVRASLGFSIFPRDGQTTAALLAAADAALYANKRERTAQHNAENAGESADRRRHRTS